MVHPAESGQSRSLPRNVDQLLAKMVELLSDGLGSVLTGLFVHGSLVAGDFAPGRSDVDLLAVLTVQPDDEVLVSLGGVHDKVSELFPTWRGHVEVEYVALDTLHQHSAGGAVEAPGVIARVSPGEHLHLLPVTPYRILGWSLVRRYGRSLIGPPAQEVIPPISEELVKEALLHHVRDWPVWVREMATAGGQAYAVLSLCRAAVLLETGEQVSKKAAASLVAQAVPAWTDVVLWARDWWYEGGSDDEPPRTVEVRRFVDETCARLG